METPYKPEVQQGLGVWGLGVAVQDTDNLLPCLTEAHLLHLCIDYGAGFRVHALGFGIQGFWVEAYGFKMWLSSGSDLLASRR